jgi:hypothetical protein
MILIVIILYLYYLDIDIVSMNYFIKIKEEYIILYMSKEMMNILKKNYILGMILKSI